MKSVRTIVLAVALACASAASASDFSAEAGIVSDYRYRGISLSDGNPAFQASLNVEHDSGIYGTAWGSTLGHGLSPEIDLTLGWSRDLTEGLSVDLSSTYFAYPSDPDSNYFEGTAAVTATHGPASATLGFSHAPRQRGTRDELGRGHGNSYAFLEGGYALPKTPIRLKAGLGHEQGWFDEVERGGKWDWTLGAEAELSPAVIGLCYVGSNADGGDRHALVGSLFLNW